MKVIILAGGFGTRLSEYTQLIPKPMVEVGDKPILYHIMSRYARFGHKDFGLALGYKAELIKKYFLDFQKLNSDFTIDLGSGELKIHSTKKQDWKVGLVDTGLNTMTGGRVKKMKEFINNESFMLTYGDGLSDVNIEQLLSFHKKHGKMVTVTAVRPTARFGEVLTDDHGKVLSFKEKPQTTQGWINGGFFVMEPRFLDLIENESSVLEKEPLEKAQKLGELMAYKHDGFWQCMDTVRDRNVLEEIWQSGNAPW